VRDEERSVWQKKLEREQKEETEQSRWGFRGMTVRAWLELLIVPLVLVSIGLLFENQQANRQQAMEEQQQALEERRAEAERELAEQRAQDEALQAYLDQISGLLLERDLRTSEVDSEVRALARARTLTVLGRLDPSRKTALMQFLVEAVLIQSVGGKSPIIGLSGADLHNLDLRPSGARRNDTSPFDIASGLEEFDGQRVLLIGIDLHGADLAGANLEGASLPGANLRDASLRYTDLRRADLRSADLSNAGLRSADLSNADLTSASLIGADLSNADLTNARGITNKALEQEADSLAFATMPTGQKYEDWRKSKGR
jgi:uncharacterized protein YjbI with pentapeptide repeats